MDRQIEYGRQRRVPWGVSESGFSALDAALDYQYQSFGVPGLGLKRGLAPGPGDRSLRHAAGRQRFGRARRWRTLRALAAEGGEGPYGFYEAIDYTPSRLPRGKRAASVAQLHGPSSGHGPGRPGELPARRADAAPLSRRADGAGHRTAAGGTACRDGAPIVQSPRHEVAGRRRRPPTGLSR